MGLRESLGSESMMVGKSLEWRISVGKCYFLLIFFIIKVCSNKIIKYIFKNLIDPLKRQTARIRTSPPFFSPAVGGGDGASRVVGERIDDGGQIFGEAYLRRKMLFSFIIFYYQSL